MNGIIYCWYFYSQSFSNSRSFNSFFCQFINKFFFTFFISKILQTSFAQNHTSLFITCNLFIFLNHSPIFFYIYIPHFHAIIFSPKQSFTRKEVLFIIFIIIFAAVYIAIFLAILKDKPINYFWMTFAVLIIVCFLPIYYQIEFSEEELSTLLTVGSMFLALSTFTKNHKIIKASVMNFLFALINYLVIIVEKRHSKIIEVKFIFTIFIMLSIVYFIITLIKYYLDERD